MARHPSPTATTVKELYGSATTCAAPRCDEPLYRWVPELETHALNSTVAHIKAASPEGPRFDPDMSAEENRAAANLLLLCRFHSSLIDDKASEFPVDLLLDWKAAQLCQPSGTDITAEQADEVLRVSIKNEITLQAEVINLGGQDGGGGAAVGAGAIGGPGGDRMTVNLDGYGPGGGGGVLVGEGKTPPDARRAKIGRGFVYGTDGGDTTVSDSDGNILLSAKGGSAGGSPWDERGTTNELSISALMVCTSIHIRDGLLFVLEGSWQSTAVLNVSEPKVLFIALVIEAGGVEPGHYTMRIKGTDPDGRACGQVSFPVVIEEPGDINRITCQIPLTIQLTGYGLYTLNVETDVAQLAVLDLAVSRVTDPS